MGSDLAAADFAKWMQPQTVIAICSLCIGFAGFVYGILSARRNRHESRLDALAHVLDPLIRAAQALSQANRARRTREELKLSFPGLDAKAEAAQRIEELFSDYEESMEEANKHFREAEAQFASRSFRFPDRVGRSIQATQKSLSEYGHYVNLALFDKADLQFASFRDDIKRIHRTARGWRLADPLEAVRRYIPKRKAPKHEGSEFELTEQEVKRVLELVHVRATTQSTNTFAVHPPKKVIDRPEILTSDEVIDELKDAVFVVRFQNGRSEMLGLPELVAFVFNLIQLSVQVPDIVQMLRASSIEGTTEVKLSFNMCMTELMRPEMVKMLLSKVSFADSPSDA